MKINIEFLETVVGVHKFSIAMQIYRKSFCEIVQAL